MLVRSKDESFEFELLKEYIPSYIISNLSLRCISDFSGNGHCIAQVESAVS